MKHTRSSAEWEIREALVAHLREIRPGSRIVHELNVSGQGSSRADVAAIGLEEVLLFEIKSERDVLKRVESQYYAFKAASHRSVVLAHRKWFEDRVTPNSSAIRFMKPNEQLDFLRTNDDLWCYPEPGPEYGFSTGKWVLDGRYRTQQPHATRLLGLLWAEELRQECSRHKIAATTKSTMAEMVADMTWLMTGREIAMAVCRQLRNRVFAEADAPVVDGGRG